jgi:hypothetical protein
VRLRRWEAWAIIDGHEKLIGRKFTKWGAEFALDWKLGDPMVVLLSLSRGTRVKGEVRKAT